MSRTTCCVDDLDHRHPHLFRRLPRRRARSLVTVLVAVLALVGTVLPAAAEPARPRPFTTTPDPLSGYIGQVACDPVARPGTKALADLVLRSYGLRGTASMERPCSDAGRSEHYDGRAWDWGVRAWVPAEKAAGDALVAWLTGPDADGVVAGNARRLGVMYLIWDHRTWEAYRTTSVPGSGWKAYKGASPHTDHVHISLSWDGAFQRTSWWTGRAVSRADLGPCQVEEGGPFVVSTAPRYGACPAPRSREAVWYQRAGRPSEGPAGAVVRYGSRGDVALACDLDGDGVDTLAVYRDGTWWLRDAPGGGSARVVQYGGPGMYPVCGDWDGDGRDGIGVVDAGSTWWLRQSASAGPAQVRFQYGFAGTTPVVGDWEGDGRDGIAVVDGAYRWWLRGTATSGSAGHVQQYGMAHARPVAGDWDGDGVDGIAVVDSGSTWWLKQRIGGSGADRSFQYGIPGAAAVAGRWSSRDHSSDGLAVVDGAR